MVLARPTNDELREKIRELVPRVDLDSMGVKAFIKLLSKEFEDAPDLKPRKDFIKETLSKVINEQQQEDEPGEADGEESANSQSESEEEESDDDDDGDGDDDDEAERAPKKKRAKVGKRSGGGGGLSEQKEISDELAAFLGQGKKMSRTTIVKELWKYIREHDLQNPSNKREIILNKSMQDVFGCKTFTMFTMNKYISAHVHPFTPVDLTAKPKKAAATKKRKQGKANAGPKKKRKTGSQPPYRLSDELQAVVGTDILPRPQVVSKIWEYIKANNLQNPEDKREILCDDKLRRIMAKKTKISMFKMNTHIGEHLLEKLDRSAYQHEEAASEESDSDDE